MTEWSDGSCLGWTERIDFAQRSKTNPEPNPKQHLPSLITQRPQTQHSTPRVHPSIPAKGKQQACGWWPHSRPTSLIPNHGTSVAAHQHARHYSVGFPLVHGGDASGGRVSSLTDSWWSFLINGGKTLTLLLYINAIWQCFPIKGGQNA